MPGPTRPQHHQLFRARPLAALALLASCIGFAAAESPAQAVGQRLWAAQGGELRIRYNHDLLRQFGVRLDPRLAPDVHGAVAYSLREDALAFSTDPGGLRGFGDGALTTRAGFVLARGERRVAVDWLSVEAGDSDPPTLVLRDAHGRAWFVAERMMYRLDEDAGRLRMPTIDLRAGPALAAFLGDPSTAGLVFGDLSLDSRLLARSRAPDLPKTCAVPEWHGTGGKLTDVLMSGFTVQQLRCRRSTDREQPFDGCDGPGGGDDGEVVFAPSAVLRNSDTETTADVPWYEKFMPGTPAPPYNNDQHPILVWNLYRIDAGGRMRQIGRSGAKHAWFSTNFGCTDLTCGTMGGNILGRGCGDEYTAASNDLEYYLGPRAEIVPSRGLWGRCGSTWDRLGPGGAPGCDGVHDPFVPVPAAVQGYYERLVARESDLERPANDGARWVFEAWYVVRDDIDIFNTMAHAEVEPVWTGFIWDLPLRTPRTSGPAIDAWVAPGAGAMQRSETLDTPEGRLRVAVRVTQAGARWRYDYAVMNLDFARAVTQGAEPNLRVLDARGMGAIVIPVPAGAGLAGLQAFDADRDPANDWSFQTGPTSVVFSAPAGANTLDWGSLHAFSFESVSAPVDGVVALQPARNGNPASYSVASLVPGLPPLFADGFE